MSRPVTVSAVAHPGRPDVERAVLRVAEHDGVLSPDLAIRLGQRQRTGGRAPARRSTATSRSGSNSTTWRGQPAGRRPAPAPCRRRPPRARWSGPGAGRRRSRSPRCPGCTLWACRDLEHRRPGPRDTAAECSSAGSAAGTSTIGVGAGRRTPAGSRCGRGTAAARSTGCGRRRAARRRRRGRSSTGSPRRPASGTGRARAARRPSRPPAARTDTEHSPPTPASSSPGRPPDVHLRSQSPADPDRRPAARAVAKQQHADDRHRHLRRPVGQRRPERLGQLRTEPRAAEEADQGQRADDRAVAEAADARRPARPPR